MGRHTRGITNDWATRRADLKPDEGQHEGQQEGQHEGQTWSQMKALKTSELVAAVASALRCSSCCSPLMYKASKS